MTSNIKIWRTDKTDILYWVERPQTCSICTLELDMEAIHFLDWGKAGLKESLTHGACAAKWKSHPLSMVPERKIVYLCDKRPDSSVLVVPKPPLIIARNRAEITNDYQELLGKTCDRTKDNTVHGFTATSIKGASIGSEEAINLCKEKDQALISNEGIKHLQHLHSTKKQLEEEQKND